MKVKLLKKLRRKSKQMVYISDFLHKGPFLIDRVSFRGIDSITPISFYNREEIDEIINEIRNDFIKDELEKLRLKRNLRSLKN